MNTPTLSHIPLIPRNLLLGNPSRSGPALSRDGTRLTWQAPLDGVMNIWIAPVDDIAAAEPLTRFTDRPIFWNAWTGDNRWVLFSKDINGNDNGRLYAVNPDTGDLRDLTPFDDIAPFFQMASAAMPGKIIASMNLRDKSWFDPYIIDVETGTHTMLYENTQGFGQIQTDWQGNLRITHRTLPNRGGSEVLFYDRGQFEPVRVIPHEDSLTSWFSIFNWTGTHVSAISSVGRNTSAMIRIDMESGAEDVLATHADADVTGILHHPQSKEPMAALADPGRAEWQILDDAAAPLTKVAACFPDSDCYIASLTADNAKWILAMTSPAQGNTYHLVETADETVTPLFAERPELSQQPLVGMQTLRIPSRDGMPLVSYLSLPPTIAGDRPQDPVPLVLNVHGGPWGRDVYCHDPDHQWLANRGYAVMSVNYRCSTGFGKAFVNAGDKEHAGKIHNDLIDAVDWAIAEGIADPDKIAIMGGSYGGYAAFVAATFTPDRFCCTLPVVGFTDVQTLLESIPPYWEDERALFIDRYGDPETEEGRALLASQSPIHKVDRITKPMLITHGANDVRCTLDQSDRIVAAMQAKDIPVTYVVFPDEGHGLRRHENRLAHAAITEAFLARHMGGRVEPVGDDFKDASHEIRAGALFDDDKRI
ncbi:S9 family peptidase [Actibacterium sp. 188UL27-1]|uniref:S9 family peptidase n=1 Tax=Actibacterium sp. 188UL27-1 TaxID=2786961 RepID=UPI00195DAC8D|nr:S9 family peptidase [Actibacterium sp. 188UL27-1]MBM7070156.1 S9 family peptidase [Actibacterium sp. 188UL27-1]